MACNLKDTIKDKIRGNAKSFIIKDNEVFIPVSNNFTLSQTYKIAQSKINKINKEYLGDKFGNPLSLNTSYKDGTGINIHISKSLQDASDVRDGNKRIDEIIKDNEQRQKEGNWSIDDNGNIIPYNMYSKLNRKEDEDDNRQNNISSDKLNSLTNKAVSELNANVRNQLLSILSSLGIDVKILDSITTKNGLDAVGSFNLMTKMIRLVKSDDFKALPEEFGHFLEDWLGKDHPLLKGIYAVIENTDEYNEVVKEYEGLYTDKELMKKEAVGQILGKAITKSIELKDKRKDNLLQHIVKQLLKWVKTQFNRITDNQIAIQQEMVNKAAKEIADMATDSQGGLDWLKINQRGDYRAETKDYELYDLRSMARSIVKGLYKTSKGMPFQVTSLEKMAVGEKRSTVRPKGVYPSGIYNFGTQTYKITNEGLKTTVPNQPNSINAVHLRKTSIGEENVKYEHIQDFYDGKIEMFVYTIQRIKDTTVAELKEDNVIYEEVDVLESLEKKYQEQHKILASRRKHLDLQQKILRTTFEKAMKDIVNNKLLSKDDRDLFNYTLESQYNVDYNKIKAERSKLETTSKLIQSSLFGKKNPTQEEILKMKDDLLIFAKIDLARIVNNTLNQSYKLDTNEQVVEFSRDRNILNLYSAIPELKSLADTAINDLYSTVINLYDQSAQGLSTFDDRRISMRDEFVRSSKSKDIHKDINYLEYGFGAVRDSPRIEAQVIADVVVSHKNIAHYEDMQDTKEIAEKVQKLDNYAKTKGKRFWDIFTEDLSEIDGRGHLSLIKPWTAEWEAERMKHLENKNSPKSKSWLDTNTKRDENGNWIPRLGYRNPKYDKIHGKNAIPELTEFYDYFQNKIIEKAKVLPTTYEISKYLIPNIFKSLFDDIANLKRSDSRKLLLQNLKESVYNYEYYDENNELVMLNDLDKKDFIPIKHLGEIDPNQKSDDLGAALIKWCQFCNMYKEMSEVLPKVRLFEELIHKNSYIKGGKIVKGDKTLLAAQIEAYIDMQILGKKNSSDTDFTISSSALLDEQGGEVGIKNINLSTLIDTSIKYTSLLNIGYNPFTAVSNVTIGNINNFYKATGGRYFSNAEMLKAFEIILTQGYDHTSKLNQLIEIIRPFQEYMDIQYMEDTYRGGSLATKFKDSGYAYTMMRKGEYINQGIPMIARLLAKKIQTKDGKTINLWDAFKLDKDNKIYWDKDATGFDLNIDKDTDHFISKLRNEVQRINQFIHGRYTSEDASVLKQHWWFRGAMLFRNWIPAALENRFIGRREDTRLGKMIEGRYNTFKDFILAPIQWTDAKGNIKPKVDFKLYLDMMGEIWAGIDKLTDKSILSELEVANMRENAIELAAIITLTGTSMIFSGGDPDKKEINAMEKFYLDQYRRLNTDITQFTNINFYFDLYNKQPLLRTYQQLLGAAQNLPHIIGDSKDDFYRSGNRKGENKEWSRLKELTPLFKQVNEAYRLFNGQEKVYPTKHF